MKKQIKSRKKRRPWFVYILHCADGTLYTGTSNNVEQRLSVHMTGKGAKYTRSRLPLTVAYIQKCANRSIACKKEYTIKKMTRNKKLKLIAATL